MELAKDAGAAQYADDPLVQAETQLEVLERAWPRKRELSRDLQGTAREVMRIAENARVVAEERSEAARLAAERSVSRAQVATANSEADRAREAAQRARDDAARAQDEAGRAHQRAAQEQQAAAAAKAEAERAKQAEQDALIGKELALARVETSRLAAERARAEADAARREKAEMQERLYQSISQILETRRTARGLIVNLSDVLFDFDRATLTPGAREKLAKLAGILVAYPGQYRVTTEGHTDSVGSEEYNLALSRARAESVITYLLTSGVPTVHVGTAVGFGESRPIASNDTAAGRQMNRRVEIVIADLDA